jgi:hypothetical protein
MAFLRRRELFRQSGTAETDGVKLGIDDGHGAEIIPNSLPADALNKLFNHVCYFTARARCFLHRSSFHKSSSDPSANKRKVLRSYSPAEESAGSLRNLRMTIFRGMI